MLMRKNEWRLFGPLWIVGVLLALAACSPGAEPATEIGSLAATDTVAFSPPEVETSEADGEPMPTSNTAPLHLCNHRYFPAVDGASWTYTSADSAVGPYSFTDSITNMRSDGFTLRGDFDGLVRTQEWSCGPEGLALLDYSGMGAAQVTTDALQVEFETTGMTGLTLPAGLAPGDEWTQSFEISGNAVLQGGLESSAEGTATAENLAIGIESVTVAAGTFDALRIERTILLDLMIQFGESGMPVTFTSEEVVWFAEGIGWVKDSFTGTIESTPVNESIELASYSVP
jgi:hypothetical protein